MVVRLSRLTLEVSTVKLATDPSKTVKLMVRAPALKALTRLSEVRVMADEEYRRGDVTIQWLEARLPTLLAQINAAREELAPE